MRIRAFVAVGAIGFLIQLAALAALLAAGCPYLPATAAAVEAAILHNFLWHERWTWADRTAGRPGAAARLMRFNLTAGSTSIAGNITFMAFYVGVVGIDPLAANVLAVASTTLANFLIADRCVFVRAALVLVAIGSPSPAAAAELKNETIDAWNQYVKAAESRIQSEAQQLIARRPGRPEGEVIAVPSGLIHRWRGAVFIPGVTLDAFLRTLMYPGTPPPQDDVLESRVLARSDDSLRVYLKLVRTTIITVTYNTEHEMTFRRPTPVLATSRSIATKIAELEDAGTRAEHERKPGDDRGFLWRLNSYWRYVQADGGVWVELESLTLSRDLPAPIRPIASPIINSVARESMTRTLQSMARWFEGRSRGSRPSDRFDGDAGRFEARANLGGELIGAGRVAMHAHRVDLEPNDRAVNRYDVGFLHHAHRPRHDHAGVVNHRPGLAARRELAVRLVGAIGKDLGGDAQA
jgi:putative flippase GtrA